MNQLFTPIRIPIPTRSLPFNWPWHAPLKDRMAKLYEYIGPGHTKDLAFALGKEYVFVHKAIVEVGSPVFYQILANVPSTPGNTTILALDEMQGFGNLHVATFRSLIEFIYTDEIKDFEKCDLQSLLKIATLFQVERLKELCLSIKIAKNSVIPSEMWQFVELPESGSSSSVQAACGPVPGKFEEPQSISQCISDSYSKDSRNHGNVPSSKNHAQGSGEELLRILRSPGVFELQRHQVSEALKSNPRLMTKSVGHCHQENPEMNQDHRQSLRSQHQSTSPPTQLFRKSVQPQSTINLENKSTWNVTLPTEPRSQLQKDLDSMRLSLWTDLKTLVEKEVKEQVAKVTKESRGNHHEDDEYDTDKIRKRLEKYGRDLW